MNKALRQALEIQAVLLTARPNKTSVRDLVAPPHGKEMQGDWLSEAVESQATSRVTASMEGR
jgi:hypothetical protein